MALVPPRAVELDAVGDLGATDTNLGDQAVDQRLPSPSPCGGVGADGAVDDHGVGPASPPPSIAARSARRPHVGAGEVVDGQVSAPPRA